ncbi:hypothetical protein DSC45_14410 [Streptomyces sp. YIM 130001]|uniref:hypothetical protein n=1 Tax=Streptomyces sp. YIM 130001 TaxID=2259644 RepID=UPI000EE2BF57|nr:hypothetical protein [Streptomyces sp. YIM 130001]RII16952.1 hypothetical protein DSC45_14410 [Streptomyces sp. YIM 130001]
MDAGLSAVLGATVGAVGTGGAAAITALLSRSQVRFQVDAEHERVLRDSRRIAYAALVEALTRAMQATRQCDFSVRAYHAAGETRRQESQEQITAEQEEANRLHRALEPHQALVIIEGPTEIALAATEAQRSLTQYALSVTQYLYALNLGEPADTHQAEVNQHRDAAMHRQKEFEFAASRVLATRKQSTA